MFARHLQEYVLQSRLEDVLKTPWKTKNATLKTCSRRLQHIFTKMNVCWEKSLKITCEEISFTKVADL